MSMEKRHIPEPEREISCLYSEAEFDDTGDVYETLMSMAEGCPVPEAVKAHLRTAAAAVMAEMKLMESVGIESEPWDPPCGYVDDL
jgi:hypothetical protein